MFKAILESKSELHRSASILFESWILSGQFIGPFPGKEKNI